MSFKYGFSTAVDLEDSEGIPTASGINSLYSRYESEAEKSREEQAGKRNKLLEKAIRRLEAARAEILE